MTRPIKQTRGSMTVRREQNTMRSKHINVEKIAGYFCYAIKHSIFFSFFFNWGQSKTERIRGILRRRIQHTKSALSITNFLN